jgi:glycosyltransferase involved in cell wall biosynthesis
MRVLQIGNANFGYAMAKELRKRGFESELIIAKSVVSGSLRSINDPLSHDSSLTSYPDWVKFYDVNKRGKTIQLIREIRNYDVIHAYDRLPIHSMLSGKPYLAQTGGDELRYKAFEKSLSGFMLRLAFKRADQFVYVWPIHKPYVEKLKIKNPMYLPRIWDTKTFTKKKKIERKNDELTIFLPTAELWETKGNDKFLYGFSKFCKDFPTKKIKLYYIDWGEDSPKAKEILSKEFVKNHVEIISGPISRERMVDIMENSDIVVDQFNSGSFTRLAMESFDFGIPIMINLDIKLHDDLHGQSPPVINAKNSDEIFVKLKYYYDQRTELKEIGSESKKWAEKNFNFDQNVEKYIEIYERIYRK